MCSGHHKGLHVSDASVIKFELGREERRYDQELLLVVSSPNDHVSIYLFINKKTNKTTVLRTPPFT